MKKVDCSEIADTYDDARVKILSDKSIELCLEMISKRVSHRKQVKLLDLGCGKGKFSIPIVGKLGYSVTGADCSKEMISKAKEKDASQCAKWDIEDAQRLSYTDRSFDVVFMSHLLHHPDNTIRVIQECFDVTYIDYFLYNNFIRYLII